MLANTFSFFMPKAFAGFSRFLLCRTIACHPAAVYQKNQAGCCCNRVFAVIHIHNKAQKPGR